MEQEINIAELLEDAPEGTILYSPICGECILVHVEDGREIVVKMVHQLGLIHFNIVGHLMGYNGGECLLFPSKDHHTWEDFKPSWKPEHKVFKPYQKVLVKTGYETNPDDINTDGINMIWYWQASFYSHYSDLRKKHILIDCGEIIDEDICAYEGNEGLLGKEVEEW